MGKLAGLLLTEQPRQCGHDMTPQKGGAASCAPLNLSRRVRDARVRDAGRPSPPLPHFRHLHCP